MLVFFFLIRFPLRYRESFTYGSEEKKEAKRWHEKVHFLRKKKFNSFCFTKSLFEMSWIEGLKLRNLVYIITKWELQMKNSNHVIFVCHKFTLTYSDTQIPTSLCDCGNWVGFQWVLPESPPTSIFFRFLASKIQTVSLPAVGT